MESDCCAWCTAPKVSFRCGQCTQTGYCSQEHARRHWPLHKLRCEKRPPEHRSGHRIFTTMEEVDAMMSTVSQQHGGFQDPATRLNVILCLGRLCPFDSFWCGFLEVGWSPVHGRGVFAKRWLPRGAVLTCYPAHMVYNNKECLSAGIYEALESIEPREIARFVNGYSFDMADDGSLKLVGLPSETSEPRLLGHMLNDSSLCDVFAGTTLDQIRDPARLQQLLVLFFRNALQHTNCVFRVDRQRMVCCIVAQRDIAPGEELLLYYSLGYWIERHYGAGHPFIQESILKLSVGGSDEFKRVYSEAIKRFDMPALASRLGQ